SAGRLRLRDVSWWIVVLNLLGSVFFGVSAVGAYTLGSGEVVNEWLVNAETVAGGVCFFVAAAMLIPEARSKGAPERGDRRPGLRSAAPGRLDCRGELDGGVPGRAGYRRGSRRRGRRHAGRGGRRAGHRVREGATGPRQDLRRRPHPAGGPGARRARRRSRRRPPHRRPADD